MLVYMPNSGINATSPLQYSDIGNVLPVAESSPDSATPQRPGTYGKMNFGMRDYQGDTATGDGKPARADLADLADYLGTRPRTAERWINKQDKYGREQPRNTVTLDQEGKRICDMYQDPQMMRRAFLASALGVEGGLQRDAIYTRGQGAGRAKPYLWDNERPKSLDTLRECLKVMEDVWNGDLDGGEPPISRGWVQMGIEANGAAGWNLYVWRFYPYTSEYDNTDCCCE